MSYSAGINIAYIDSLIEHMRHIHATVGQHGNVQPASVINLAGQHSPGSAVSYLKVFALNTWDISPVYLFL